MKTKYLLDNIKNLKIDIEAPCIIFINWDLWSWKTTLSKYIINNLLWVKDQVLSPTYVYYNKYMSKNIPIYHFDLYRLKSYEEFFSIWWEDIFDNNQWIIIVEWPEIISKYYKSDISIDLKKTDNELERIINIKKA